MLNDCAILANTLRRKIVVTVEREREPFPQCCIVSKGRNPTYEYDQYCPTRRILLCLGLLVALEDLLALRIELLILCCIVFTR